MQTIKTAAYAVESDLSGRAAPRRDQRSGF